MSSERKSETQKRQRIERYERRKVKADEETNRLELQQQQRQQLELKLEMQLEYARLHPCRIIKVAEGTLCTIFSFLPVKDHFNFAKTCTTMEKISLTWQSSPTTIDLNLVVAKFSAYSDEFQDGIIKRLMNFRPLKLIVSWFNSQVRKEDSDFKQMINLRELTLQTNGRRPNLSAAVEWLSYLTKLTKLTIPDRGLPMFTALPPSLTHLEFLGIDDNDGEFTCFQSGPLLHFNLSNQFQTLQVLKLPKYYCELMMLEIGKLCPQLRELSLGYFNVRDRALVNFSALETCRHLETLTVGIDFSESVCDWKSLAAITTLRRLTISIYKTVNPPNLFAGLSQVTQLTHLRLIPHTKHIGVDISSALAELTYTETAGVGHPLKLTSLLISTELVTSDLAHLSVFTTLQELMIPPNWGLVQLSRLHTLHVVKGDTEMLKYYQHQLETVIYNDEKGLLDYQTTGLLDILLEMKQLTTLKLRSQCCIVHQPHLPDAISLFQYFRQQLPVTVVIEVDDSMSN